MPTPESPSCLHFLPNFVRLVSRCQLWQPAWPTMTPKPPSSGSGDFFSSRCFTSWVWAPPRPGWSGCLCCLWLIRRIISVSSPRTITSLPRGGTVRSLWRRARTARWCQASAQDTNFKIYWVSRNRAYCPASMSICLMWRQKAAWTVGSTTGASIRLPCQLRFVQFNSPWSMLAHMA